MLPMAPQDEQATLIAARLYTEYLRACRDDQFSMSLLPPGRFLMPGNLANTPALTFAPLDLPADGTPPDGSLWAMMQRRYQAYQDIVIRPFFRDHFSRLDRQIVLVDALSAFNAGPEALRDLEAALSQILDCFRIGRSTLLSTLFRPRIDRILFAATKADHLHHTSHDRLEAILRRMVHRAATTATFAGAQVDVVALAAVRATREAQVSRDGETLPSILGTPAKGEVAGGDILDGETEVATFPGDLPVGIDDLFKGGDLFRGLSSDAADATDYRFLRFRPPHLEATGDGQLTLPHIRLDRALQFLIGDRLQ
jgi:predicted YcjX-like family ATPase